MTVVSRRPCTVCCEFFVRDADLILKDGQWSCETNNAPFISGGGIDCGFHYAKNTDAEMARRLANERMCYLDAIGISKRGVQQCSCPS